MYCWFDETAIYLKLLNYCGGGAIDKGIKHTTVVSSYAAMCIQTNIAAVPGLIYYKGNFFTNLMF